MKPLHTSFESPIRSLKSAIFLFLISSPALHAGLPEPGLVMYGVVRNSANNNARLTTGTLTWSILPPSGSAVTISAPLTDISGQFSYVLRVPFESVVGSATLSPNTLQLNSAITSYLRTNLTLTVNGTNYPATITPPALGYFTFTTSDRGRMEEVDLAVTAPGLGVIPSNPSFTGLSHLANGQVQFTVNGTIGQTYTLFGSTDLVYWAAVSMFTLTNSSATVSDLTASNFLHRFYKLGP